MDSSATTIKPSSNISDLVQKFAKVCRFKSIGVVSNQDPNNGQKVCPQPIDGVFSKTHESAAIMKLFDTVSGLKLAYIQLQHAHIPYNPQNIQLADDRIVSKLETLCDIKRFYKHVVKPQLSYSIVVEEIEHHESKLGNLKSQVQAKEFEIVRLRRDVAELDFSNAEMEEFEGQIVLGSRDSFQGMFEAATKSIHDFAKPLISFMKASKCDLNKAVNSIEGSVIYTNRSHKKYAFEAYISRRMFHGFSSQSYNVDDTLRYYSRDPFDGLIEYPNSNFGKFCSSKYLLLVHRKMEALFFGNLDQRGFVLSGGHPRTQFYMAFVKMAKSVWVLQAMAALNDPKAEIFGVQRGSEFSETYMENIVEIEDYEKDQPVKEGRLRVGFMIMPGFRIGETVIKSRVYLSRLNPIHVQ
ncbi:hypothetical protein GIB67_027845 [Kingdonia uniflora]|uniref:DUF641 domain-containing protein n=1 Tax=Kingdonia uniflora TaxID=39325 RepID=A0A7J7NZJ9_9MAGN|nr:hypothetical protein GIB67_020130 [Kingdonia uniflora]KAF6174374.1 hypothetical protein GIB67_027845 [Kingdonia uniflora]